MEQSPRGGKKESLLSTDQGEISPRAQADLSLKLGSIDQYEVPISPTFATEDDSLSFGAIIHFEVSSVSLNLQVMIEVEYFGLISLHLIETFQ